MPAMIWQGMTNRGLNCQMMFLSEHIDRMDKLSLHMATASLSVTIIIALLVYWLQKSDDNKEQYEAF